MNDAVIVDVVRTASGKGKPGGALSGWHPVDLLATVLKALVERNGLDSSLVDDVIGGCVSQSDEQALNITRTAVLAAGFPEEVPATTLTAEWRVPRMEIGLPPLLTRGPGRCPLWSSVGPTAARSGPH
jgi:acetyl-CoA acetyltransferase